MTLLFPKSLGNLNKIFLFAQKLASVNKKILIYEQHIL